MFKSLEILTPPGAEPVTLARAKRHLRVTFADDDEDITSIISVAREEAENWLCRPIRSALYRATFSAFATPFVIAGQGPVSVTAVDYLNSSAVRATVPADQYHSGHGFQGQIICPHEAWPTDAAAEPLPRITFATGFVSVPPTIQQAILLGLAGLYDHRSKHRETSFELRENQAWQDLLWPYRIVSI